MQPKEAIRLADDLWDMAEVLDELALEVDPNDECAAAKTVGEAMGYPPDHPIRLKWQVAFCLKLQDELRKDAALLEQLLR